MKNQRESFEDYLETILMLQENKENIRAIDIARKMQFSKPSVSIAIKKMVNDDLIKVNSSNFIELTAKGLEIAQKTLERHVVLTRWFTHIGVNPVTAEEDACRIEHDLSEETWNAIREFSKEYNKKQ